MSGGYEPAAEHVAAAAQALRAWVPVSEGGDEPGRAARVALLAAGPLIAAEERERVAKAIEAEQARPCATTYLYGRGRLDGLAQALAAVRRT